MKIKEEILEKEKFIKLHKAYLTALELEEKNFNKITFVNKKVSIKNELEILKKELLSEKDNNKKIHIQNQISAKTNELQEIEKQLSLEIFYITFKKEEIVDNCIFNYILPEHYNEKGKLIRKKELKFFKYIRKVEEKEVCFYHPVIQEIDEETVSTIILSGASISSGLGSTCFWE